MTTTSLADQLTALRARRPDLAAAAEAEGGPHGGTAAVALRAHDHLAGGTERALGAARAADDAAAARAAAVADAEAATAAYEAGADALVARVTTELRELHSALADLDIELAADGDRALALNRRRARLGLEPVLAAKMRLAG